LQKRSGKIAKGETGKEEGKTSSSGELWKNQGTFTTGWKCFFFTSVTEIEGRGTGEKKLEEKPFPTRKLNYVTSLFKAKSTNRGQKKVSCGAGVRWTKEGCFLSTTG